MWETLLAWWGDPANRQAVAFFLLTMFGCAAMHVFALGKGFSGASAWLKKVLPGRREESYHRLDFVLVTVSGSIVGTVFFSPSSGLEALAAGFGWVGAVQVLVGKSEL